MRDERRILIVLFFICIGFQVLGQEKIELSGKIITESGEPLEGAFIFIKNTPIYETSDKDGQYRLQLDPGEYQLSTSMMGYDEQTHEVKIEAQKKQNFNFILKTNSVLDEVILSVKTKLQEVQESSYNVVALDASKLHNTNLDVSETLDRVSGVKVRRDGGMGSDYNVMLNGFTGKHVKFFIDGVPMEGFNAAFQLNNIPVNMAKRIEVYKGVVPISFGSDALGGAINIVTTDGGKQNFLDASYSYGSFNTHKSFVRGAYTAPSGFTARLTAYQNYSDNNYKVDADIVDLENHQFTGDIRRVRRFHDRYRNFTLGGKIGVVNKSYADELLLGFNFSDVYDEIQNPAYMKIAFGEKYTTAQSVMPSLSYRKRNLFVDHLDVTLSANYSAGNARNIDDSYRRYNWLGEYILTDAPGEFNYSKNHFKDHNASVNTSISYLLNYNHRFTLNNVLNSFWRKNRDEAEPKPEDKYPTETLKNILALGYQFQPTDRWSFSAFGKQYYNLVKRYADPNAGNNYQHMSKSTEDLGYGVATSYFLTEDLQIKGSYEKAFRVPTGRELFGAGNDFDLGNPDLKSESSDNLNLGLSYSWKLAKDQQLDVESSFIYRDIRDFIRMVPDPSNGVLKPGNEALVKNRGIDLGLNYLYKKLFSLEASMAYQNMRNKLKYREGKEVVSTIYNDRIPNMPYLYGNTSLNFYFDNVFKNRDHLGLSYNLMYIHEFDYGYESYGGRKIPSQLSHDFSLDYSFKDGRYTISLAARNILDEKLYDNFSLEKPGRSFSVKFRYFLNQFN